MNLYSASVEDRDTVSCFRVFQEIGEPPSCINQAVRYLLVNGQAEKSESHQAVNFKSTPARKRIPWSGLLFK